MTNSGDISADGTSTTRHEAREFPCRGCGADLTFHIGAQSLRCEHCGYTQAISLDESATIEEQDYAATLERLAAQKTDQSPTPPTEFREVRCDACGANVRFTGTLTSSDCAYCGTALQVRNVHDAPERIPVDGVIPFQVPRKQAQENLRKWVKSRWFAPTAFTRHGADGSKLSGVYVPFWTFDSMTFNQYSGMRGDYYYVTVGSGKNQRQERRVRWSPASGAFQRFFDDVLVIAGTGMPNERVHALQPWPLSEAKPFMHEFLAGLLARTYDVTLDAGFEDARGQIATALEADVRQRIGGDTQQIQSIDTRHDAISFKHLLLPVWLTAYRFNNKPYQLVINAATGEVQGDRPYSWVKITLTVLAGIAVAGAIAILAQQ